MEDFGRSVKTFPLVGAVLGVCYALPAYALYIWLPSLGWEVPRHLASVLLLLLPLLLTGGIVLVLTLAAVVWGWGRISGLPTEVLTVKGQPMQVLTDPGWTTCTWQDRKQPCRPMDR